MLTWIDSCRLQFFALSCKHRNLMQMYACSFIILRRVSHRKYLSTIGDISTRTKWLVSKRYVQAVIVIGLMTLAIAVPLFTRAFAITDVGSAGVFELDGNIVKDSSGTFPTDWSASFPPRALSSLCHPAEWTPDGPTTGPTVYLRLPPSLPAAKTH